MYHEQHKSYKGLLGIWILQFVPSAYSIYWRQISRCACKKRWQPTMALK